MLHAANVSDEVLRILQPINFTQIPVDDLRANLRSTLDGGLANKFNVIRDSAQIGFQQRRFVALAMNEAGIATRSVLQLVVDCNRITGRFGFELPSKPNCGSMLFVWRQNRTGRIDEEDETPDSPVILPLPNLPLPNAYANIPTGIDHVIMDAIVRRVKISRGGRGNKLCCRNKRGNILKACATAGDIHKYVYRTFGEAFERYEEWIFTGTGRVRSLF